MIPCFNGAPRWPRPVGTSYITPGYILSLHVVTRHEVTNPVTLFCATRELGILSPTIQREVHREQLEYTLGALKQGIMPITLGFEPELLDCESNALPNEPKG